MFQAIRFQLLATTLVVVVLTLFCSEIIYGQTIVANIPIGNSTQAVVNPTTNRAYVVYKIPSIYSDGPKQILVVDVAAGAVIAAIDTGEIVKMVVNPTTNRIYALAGGSWEQGNRVMVIDGNTNQILNVIAVPDQTFDIAVNPLTNRIYGAQGFTASDLHQRLRAYVIDGTTDTIIGATAYYPDHWGQRIAVNPTTNRVYVFTGTGPEAFFVFNSDLTSLETTIGYDELNISPLAIDINPVANKIYALGMLKNQGNSRAFGVAVIDGNTNAVTASMDVGNTQYAQSFVVNPTTDHIYVVHGGYDDGSYGYNILTELDGATNSIVSNTFIHRENVDEAAPINGLAVNPQTNRILINRKYILSVIDPVDSTPPVLTTPNMIVGATGPSGAQVYFSASATDNSNVQPAIQCDFSSGSIFPIGTTPVTCRAVDTSGNPSAPQTFSITVVDTPPNLLLPGDVVTNATSPSGGEVTYFASADDAVSGPLTAQCNPASGSTFPVGVTTVNCSATDAAGNISTGSFNVYVLSGDQAYTPPDSYDFVVQPANGPTITFTYVGASGVTTVTPIDAATVGSTPAGFALSNGIAYQISTTATFYDYVQLQFVVPGPLSEADFNNLSILHNNNGTLEDVTVGRSYDAQSQSGTITAYTYSFSPFYLAKRVGLRVSPLFAQTQAFKAGSTIPIKLQLLNDAGANVSSPTTQVRARNLVRLGTNTTSSVNDAGNANPDLNFRYGSSGYIFNLSTKGLASGQYVLSFYVGNDRSFFYTVKFEVK